jgi:hypothetical protein
VRNTGRSNYSGFTHKSGGWLRNDEFLNTNDTEVYVQEPLIKLDEFDPKWYRSCSTDFEFQDSERKL